MKLRDAAWREKFATSFKFQHAWKASTGLFRTGRALLKACFYCAPRQYIEILQLHCILRELGPNSDQTRIDKCSRTSKTQRFMKLLIKRLKWDLTSVRSEIYLEIHSNKRESGWLSDFLSNDHTHRGRYKLLSQRNQNLPSDKGQGTGVHTGGRTFQGHLSGSLHTEKQRQAQPECVMPERY